MYIKENLAYLRNNAHLSLRSLAKKTGISNVGLRKIELGMTPNPSIGIVIIICKYFNIQLDDFVYTKLEEKKTITTKVKEK